MSTAINNPASQEMQAAVELPAFAASSISGRTKIVVLLAYPSEHVRTPKFFNAHCLAYGIDAVMVAAKVPPDALPSTLAGLRQIQNLIGIVVTVPHKAAIANYMDVLEGVSEQAGVVNVARRTEDGRFVGRLYDGFGFVEGLRARGIVVKGMTVALHGAGGAATAIGHALCESGIAKLILINRTAQKAERLAMSLRQTYPNTQVGHAESAHDVDLAVNGTSLGLRTGDALPFDPSELPKHAIVAEVVMQPDVTPLLQRASEVGLQIHKGVHMVEAQIPKLVEFLVSAPAGRTQATT